MMKNLINLISAVFVTALSFSSAKACVPNYTPVSGDNTASLNAATIAAASTGTELGLPAGTIQISGTWIWPTNFRWCGQGQGITVVQKMPNSGTASMTSNGRPAPEMIFLNGFPSASAGNYYAHDATIDFNGFAQPPAQFYFGLIGSYISSFTVERMTFQNPLGGGMFGIATTDQLIPTAPDGQQINGSITIRDTIFNGANQVYGQYADLIGLVSATSVTFENNVVENNGASCLSGGFNKSVSIRHNSLINCWRGIYQETNQEFTIADNNIFWTAQPAGGGASTSVDGIWIVDANQTYVNGGYAGNKRGRIVGNHVHDINLATGTGGVQGVRISAPALSAQDIIVEGNTFANLGVADGSGVTTGTLLEGGMDTILIHMNTYRNFASPSVGVTTSASYDGVSISVNVQSIDNFCTGVNSCNSTASQNCPTETDPNDPATVLLLHMRGAAGSTSFLDSSVSPHAMTAHGAAQITTSASVFCGSSGAFDGATSDIETSDAVNLHFSGDYSLDFWAFVANLSPSAQTIISKPNSNWYSPYKIVVLSGGQIDFLSSSTGTAWDIASGQSMGLIAAQRWTHIEIDHCSGVYYPFINGVLGTTFTSSAVPMVSSDNLKIGMDRTNQFYGGELQEFRFSNICRHTSNFALPTAPY